jgi:hypothetical protein
MWWSGLGLLAIIFAKIWYSIKRNKKKLAQAGLTERENEKCLLTNESDLEDIENMDEKSP